MKERIDKGKSLVIFPDEYVCIDVETSGLDFEYDEIIEVAAALVKNGTVIDKYVSLVKPSFPIPSFIEDLTGIRNSDLLDAPDVSEVMPELDKFIGSFILVGHNVHFDINFLYDAFEKVNLKLTNDFVDTMRIGRKLHPEMPHHRLGDLVEKYGVQQDRKHRAENDVLATQQCYEAMKTEIADSCGFDNFAQLFVKKSNRAYKDMLNSVNAETDEFDETNPIYGKIVVFTGALSSMQRKDAFQIVANLGGIPSDNINKNTNYLVVGNDDFARSVKKGKTAKMLKAEKYKEQGLDIEVLSENTFFQIIK